MSNDLKNLNPRPSDKAILSDPVAVFTSLDNKHDKASLNALKKLAHETQSLKQQFRETKNRARVISRDIGEARREGKPVNALLTSMQETSLRLKDIEKALSGAEGRVLDFFNTKTSITATDGSTSGAAHSNRPTERIYAATKVDMDSITISPLENEQEEWNSYVASNPATTIHHHSEWKDLLQQSYGIDGLYLFARDNNSGNIVGILPLARLKSRLFGDFLVSMPWFARGGAVADHPQIENRLMQAANEQASTLGISHIEYRDDIPREGLPVQAHKVNMVLDLPRSADELWRSFSSKLRSQIRRPQRENPQLMTGGKELLNDFYRVYSRNMRDLGSPAHSKYFIGTICDAFPENSWIFVLYLRKRPVAAGLLLGHRDTLEIPLASTIRDVNSLSLNMLLYWEILKYAIENGYRYFDFGRSSKGAGTYKFKRQWGARPRQLYWHYWLGESGELPSLNTSNPKYTLIINIWKKLPVALTRLLGPIIVKNLP